MLNKLKQRKESGFTIIEVLIVLAIAGLIMIVVFLAVPALNRNAHNNQYKTEANNLLSSYQEVMNNNGGTPLATSGTQAATDLASVKSAANLKTITTVTLVAKTTNAQSPAVGAATIIEGVKCNSSLSSTTGYTPVSATGRDVAIIYGIEASSGNDYQCVSS